MPIPSRAYFLKHSIVLYTKLTKMGKYFCDSLTIFVHSVASRLQAVIHHRHRADMQLR